jgi:DNA processing protein
MRRRELTDAERLDWLRLIRSENVGPATFLSLMRHFDFDAAAAIAAAPELSRRGGRKRAIRIVAADDIEGEIAALHDAGGRSIALCEPDYPDALAAIHDPPPVLSILGRPDLLARHSIAVVGARNASAAGRRIAREIAADLGKSGLVIVSGMARGIDTAAHEGALATGTVAVLAGGIDVVYPRENQTLYERIRDEGVVISEQRLGLAPTARHFPPRNRLVSGLSAGTLVVEAAPRSGSLITARLALEQGRDVFAVPGSPLDPRYRGTNGLIREGAVLTEGADDVLANLGVPRLAGEPVFANSETTQDKTPQDVDIYELKDSDLARAEIETLLGPAAISIDELVRECQLSPAVVQTVLLELELAGRLERHPGNRVSLAS